MAAFFIVPGICFVIVTIGFIWYGLAKLAGKGLGKAYRRLDAEQERMWAREQKAHEERMYVEKAVRKAQKRGIGRDTALKAIRRS